MNAFEVAKKNGKTEELHSQLVELAESENHSKNGGTSIPATFLLVLEFDVRQLEGFVPRFFGATIEAHEPTPNIGGCSVWSLQLFGWFRYTPACDCSRDLLTLGSAGNPDIVGSQKLGLGLGLDLDVLETPLVLRHGAENEIILTIK
jgi:hypothetical protein